MRIWIVVALTAGLGGCAASYMVSSTTFKPGVDRTTFEYRAEAAADIGGFDSPSGEERRMEALREHLRLNSMCQGGYTITSRSEAVDAQGAFGKRGYVYYGGKCS